MKSMKNNEVGKTFRTTHNKKLNKKLYSRVYSIVVRRKMVKNNLKMDLLKHLLEDPILQVLTNLRRSSIRIEGRYGEKRRN